VMENKQAQEEPQDDAHRDVHEAEACDKAQEVAGAGAP